MPALMLRRDRRIASPAISCSGGYWLITGEGESFPTITRCANYHAALSRRLHVISRASAERYFRAIAGWHRPFRRDVAAFLGDGVPSWLVTAVPRRK